MSHIQGHKARGWRTGCHCCHVTILLQSKHLRIHIGWMRRVIWACGRSLTDTSLTSAAVISVKVIRAGDQTRKRAQMSHAISTVGPDTTHHCGVPAS